jgi:hypothetical protein
MPTIPKPNRRTWALAILLLAVLLQANIQDLLTPFWKQTQYNPLTPVMACADEFLPFLSGEERVGYFYDHPSPATFFADNRSAYQLQMQYALVPILLDSRPEVVRESGWVIGYFEDAKMALSQAQAQAVDLGLEIAATCGNTVLMRKAQ